MKVIKLYQNGKLFDSQEGTYTDIIQIYLLVKQDKPFKVLNNFTKQDLTSYYVNKVKFVFEDVLPESRQKSA